MKSLSEIADRAEQCRSPHHSEMPVEVDCEECGGTGIIEPESGDILLDDSCDCEECEGTGKVMEA